MSLIGILIHGFVMSNPPLPLPSSLWGEGENEGILGNKDDRSTFISEYQLYHRFLYHPDDCLHRLPQHGLYSL